MAVAVARAHVASLGIFRSQEEAERVFQLVCPKVRRVCALWVGEKLADDMAQETFYKAWAKIATFRGDAAFETWLIRIAINTCLMSVRRSQEKLTDQLSDSVGNFLTTPGVRGTSELFVDPLRFAEASKLWDAIELFFRERPQYRSVLVARFIMGMNPSEIVDFLGLPLSTVKPRIFYGRRKLQSFLRQCGYRGGIDLL